MFHMKRLFRTFPSLHSNCINKFIWRRKYSAWPLRQVIPVKDIVFGRSVFQLFLNFQTSSLHPFSGPQDIEFVLYKVEECSTRWRWLLCCQSRLCSSDIYQPVLAPWSITTFVGFTKLRRHRTGNPRSATLNETA